MKNICSLVRNIRLVFGLLFKKQGKSAEYSGPSVWRDHPLFPGNSVHQFVAFRRKKYGSDGAVENQFREETLKNMSDETYKDILLANGAEVGLRIVKDYQEWAKSH